LQSVNILESVQSRNEKSQSFLIGFHLVAGRSGDF